MLTGMVSMPELQVTVTWLRLLEFKINLLKSNGVMPIMPRSFALLLYNEPYDEQLSNLLVEMSQPAGKFLLLVYLAKPLLRRDETRKKS